MRIFLLLLILVTMASSPVYAHNLWLERDGNGPIRVYFGHYDTGMLEQTGERLDIIKAETLFPADILVSQERRADHIELAVSKSGDVALEEAMKPRKTRIGQEIVRMVFMARCGRSETVALLSLDLVPQAPESNSFTLLLEGKPLPMTEITVYDPARQGRSYRTDAAGRVAIESTASGRYLLLASSILDRSGEVDAIAYDKIRYGFSLTYTVENK
ncbi:MAG: hypothetical protein JXR59_02335 [Desulfuromonadaceae bacterium]|nr:hypothetical protein [Desulfuromonadaceae bacterium]